eukprot:TRINITY_DN1557_c0_g1_i1.p1 TRINITY_DN1557_c0_g1~~TRINITY_DN1557_c0_g1_i1.p1  ORF type:complete len:328 (-),score=66.43 TRINITY_DN1557_c0_g1_i1:107-1090(-)
MEIKSKDILRHLEGTRDEFDYWGDESVEEPLEASVEEATQKPTQKTTFRPAYVSLDLNQFQKPGHLMRSTEGFETCSVCYEEFEKTELIALNGCGHRFCSACLAGYCDFSTKDVSRVKHEVCFYKLVNEREMELFPDVLYGIKCPHLGCQNIIEFRQVQKLATPECFERFAEMVFKMVFEEQYAKDFPPCIACSELSLPLGDCNSGYVCSVCKFEFCSTCRCSPHPPRTCKEYAAYLLECKKQAQEEAERKKRLLHMIKVADKKTMENYRLWRGNYEAMNWVCFCPKCKNPIEKNGGCDHMKCNKCLTDFYFSSSIKLGEVFDAHKI